MNRPAPPPRPAATADIPGVEDLEPIGRGGFGVVYRGRQRELDRQVAVKVISSPGTPEAAVERWRREVTAMGRLSNHPNIVAVYAGGVTDDGSPYLIMPYVPGGSLGDQLREKGPLGAAEVASLAEAISRLARGEPHQPTVLQRKAERPTRPGVFAPPEPVPGPAPAPMPVPVRRPGTSGRPGAIAAAVLVVGLLAGVIGWAATRGDDGGSGPPPQQGAEPSGETSTSTEGGGGDPVAAEIDQAATEYFEALSSNELGFAYSLLSPGFREVQSPASFLEFWSGKVVAVVGEPTVEAADRTAVVAITIDGRREDFQLSFVQGEQDNWLVDGPRPG